MSFLEALAALCGLANIVLIARRSLWNYAFGMVMVCIYFLVFLDARLYSAAGLQIFFLGSQLYGWWYWRRAVSGAEPVPVRRVGRTEGLVLVAAGVAGTLLLGMLMSRLTDAAAPFADAGNAAWSMVAQILTDRRYIESWPLWIAINVFSVWHFANQKLLVTAGLYAVFLCIAAWGWDQWHRAAKA